MAVQKLTERQMRWSLTLARYNFTISYLPGKENIQADALSRRDQDIPVDTTDERIQHRTAQLIKPEIVRGIRVGTVIVSRAQSIHLDLTCYTGGIKVAPAVVDILDELSSQWAQARQEDPSYDKIV